MARDPVIILAGGFGTRLRALDATRPKPMVPVHGRPFLEWLLLRLKAQGFSRFLLSTGYLAEQIESYPWEKVLGCQVSSHRETTPLGTGGATRKIFAEDSQLTRAWVVNGDTLLSQDLPQDGEGDRAFYTALSAGDVFDAEPNLHVQGTLVTHVGPGGSLFDAGAVWTPRQSFVGGSEETPCSVHELLKGAMMRNEVEVRNITSDCYDIGTPKRFERFENYLTSRPLWLANVGL